MTESARNKPEERLLDPSVLSARKMQPRKPTERLATVAANREYSADPVPLAPHAVESATTDFLANRRSTRSGGEISLSQLATTLLSANRVIKFERAEDGYVRSWRPNPSAGGRHPIDLLVDVCDVPELGSGLYWFDAFRWSLRHEPSPPASVAGLRTKVRQAVGLDNDAAVTLHLMATFHRTESWYSDAATLVWRDAGALIATLQFAATAAGIGACASGNAGEFELDDTIHVGSVVLGRTGR